MLSTTKLTVLAFVLAFVLFAVSSSSLPIFTSNTDLNNGRIVTFLNTIFQDGSDIVTNYKQTLSVVYRYLTADLKQKILDRVYQYFAFIPIYMTTAYTTQPTGTTFATGCYRNNQVTNMKVEFGHLLFDLVVSNPVTNSSCKDFYLFATLDSIQFHHFGEGTHTVFWDLKNLDPALLWDVNTNGIRIFRFLYQPEDTLMALLQTALLFEPEIIGPEVNPEIAQMNVEFLRAYTGFTYADRPGAPIIDLNTSDIGSGDFFGITRMDGLDPMIIFGMGGTTGHTTVALWFEDGLYITESQVNSSYWPTNNIQRTPWATWVAQAREADYNFVHVPLTAAARAIFNETAAREQFYALQGTPYGYHNFLFGWIDTASGNFPCIPPDYEYCLSPEAVMVASGLVDRLSKATANKMYNQALTHRVNKPWGTFNTTAQIFQYAYQALNLTFEQLIVMPEQDSWVYSDGKSLVCDVFVCTIWKAAGLFGSLADDIQCTELTPRDVYSMNVLDTNPANRPQICQETDPDLPFCQLGGLYQMQLPGFGQVAPYANMDQNCPGLPPQYTRPSNC